MELTDTQKTALREWVENEAREAALLFRALDKLYPGLPVDRQVQAWAVSRPSQYSEFITAVAAKYTATDSDVEREIGRRVLTESGTELDRLRRQNESLSARLEDNAAENAAREVRTRTVQMRNDINQGNLRTSNGRNLSANQVNTLAARIVSAEDSADKRIVSAAVRQGPVVTIVPKLREVYDLALTLEHDDQGLPTESALSLAIEARV